MTKDIRSINLPFCGFYNSYASEMIDQEIESTFADENGNCLNVPEETYFKKEYYIDNKAIEMELVKAYVDAFCDRFEGETGMALNAVFEAMTSPREYNFETDRVFVDVPFATVKKLFAASKKDKHKQLALVIKDKCTSYDGFISHYSNDLATWLENPLEDWDHNELKILLQAVLAIHMPENYGGGRDFPLWDLLESWTSNGGLSNAVWEAMPAKTQEFCNLQRDYGKAIDFDLWVETGKAYPDGTTQEEIDTMEPLPEPRCKETIELPL